MTEIMVVLMVGFVAGVVVTHIYWNKALRLGVLALNTAKGDYQKAYNAVKRIF